MRQKVAISTVNCSSEFFPSEGEMKPKISVSNRALAERKAIETSFTLSSSFWYALLSRSFSSSTKLRYHGAVRMKANALITLR